MARIVGPRVKLMRAVGIELPGLSRKSIEKRPFRPGQHGQARRKLSDYGLRLLEKQKLRFNYGLGELQLRRLMTEAASGKGVTGDRLLELLERRLDNVVFRAGLAPTIPAARQLVVHGHISINGKRVDRPSYRVRRGEQIGPREKSRDMKAIVESLGTHQIQRPDWLSFDEATKSVTVSDMPGASSCPFEINIQLVIEHFSRSL